MRNWEKKKRKDKLSLDDVLPEYEKISTCPNDSEAPEAEGTFKAIDEDDTVFLVTKPFGVLTSHDGRDTVIRQRPRRVGKLSEVHEDDPVIEISYRKPMELEDKSKDNDQEHIF